MSVRACLPFVVVWAVVGLATSQQDTEEAAASTSRDRRQVDPLADALDQDQLAQTLYDYRDKKAPSGFLGMRGKKAPSGFLGMRGKKDEEDSGVLDQDFGTSYSEDFSKRAPSGFLGMRGKKAPSGFLGMRGRRTPVGNRGLPRQPAYQDYPDIDALIETLQNIASTHKRAPSGFLGMRGKRQSSVTAHEEQPQPHDKRAPSGFLGMRG